MTDAQVEARFTDLYTDTHPRVLRFVQRRAADRAEGTDVELTTLAALPPQHRDVLVLRYWDECSTPEIAAVLA